MLETEIRLLCVVVRGDAKMLKHKLIFRKLSWKFNKKEQRDGELVKDRCKLKSKFLCLFVCF